MRIYEVKSKAENAILGAEDVEGAVKEYESWLRRDWEEFLASDAGKDSTMDDLDSDDYRPHSVVLVGEVENWPEEEEEPERLLAAG